jgi:hypothetical protein
MADAKTFLAKIEFGGHVNASLGAATHQTQGSGVNARFHYRASRTAVVVG